MKVTIVADATDNLKAGTTDVSRNVTLVGTHPKKHHHKKHK